MLQYKDEDIQKAIQALNSLTVSGIDNNTIVAVVADVLRNGQKITETKRAEKESK